MSENAAQYQGNDCPAFLGQFPSKNGGFVRIIGSLNVQFE